MTDLDLTSVTGGVGETCSVRDRIAGTAQGVANAVAGSTRKLIAGTKLSTQTLPEYEATLGHIEYPVPRCRPW